MNPRQYTGLAVLLLTGLCAVAVFVLVFLYVDDVRSEVGPTATVYELDQPVSALASVPSEALREVEVPERWIPEDAIRHPDQMAGLVAAADYEPGTLLQAGMLELPPVLEPGFREVAIMVDAETGVAGKVFPGDRVDIIATIAGNDDLGIPPRAEVWVSDALVLEIGALTEVDDEDAVGNFTTTAAVPVTFALNAEETLRLAYGESFSVKLRLALRPAGDDAEVPEEFQVYVDALAEDARGNDDSNGDGDNDGGDD